VHTFYINNHDAFYTDSGISILYSGINNLPHQYNQKLKCTLKLKASWESDIQNITEHKMNSPCHYVQWQPRLRCLSWLCFPSLVFTPHGKRHQVYWLCDKEIANTTISIVFYWSIT